MDFNFYCIKSSERKNFKIPSPKVIPSDHRRAGSLSRQFNSTLSHLTIQPFLARAPSFPSTDFPKRVNKPRIYKLTLSRAALKSFFCQSSSCAAPWLMGCGHRLPVLPKGCVPPCWGAMAAEHPLHPTAFPFPAQLAPQSHYVLEED